MFYEIPYKGGDFWNGNENTYLLCNEPNSCVINFLGVFSDN